MLREIFLAGNWQEVDRDADTGWTSASNILLSLADFEVDANNPLIVTSPTGGFTSSHESMILSLFASNDENRGLYNVIKVLDSNTLMIDPRCRGSAWTTESTITGRIHNGGISDLLNNSSYLVMRAPAATGTTLEVYFTIQDGRWIRSQGLPKGDWFNPPATPPVAGARTLTTLVGVDTGLNTRVMRWQAYYADTSDPMWGVIGFYSDTQDKYGSWIWGELENTAVGDTYPTYIHGRGTDYDPFFWNVSGFYMLNESDVSTVFLATYYKAAFNQADTGKRESQAGAMLQRGRVKTYKSIVIGTHTVNGGYVRGNTPYEFLNENFTDYEDRGGFWVAGRIVWPKNGDDDPKILNDASW